ncbi:DMT family transporter [Phyllobacterium phragmitis]|nr:DMT family transporter [Phyllobacterium phragmitis]
MTHKASATQKLTSSISSKPQGLSIWATVLMILIFALWGGQQVAIKIGNTELAPIFQAGIRSIGASVLMTMWFLVKGTPPWRMGVGPGAAALLGVLFTLDFALLFLGLNETTASRGTILYYTGPIMIAVGAAVILPSERIGRLGIAGFGLAFLGVLAVLWRNETIANHTSITGDLLCLGAAAAWASTILVIKVTRLIHVPANAVLYFQLLGSAIALPLLSYLVGEEWSAPQSAVVVQAVLFQVVFVAFLSYLVFFWMLQRFSAGTLSAYSFLAPVFGVLLSNQLLGEQVSPLFAIGTLMVVCGLYLVAKGK